jgi:hypothetical protein
MLSVARHRSRRSAEVFLHLLLFVLAASVTDKINDLRTFLTVYTSMFFFGIAAGNQIYLLVDISFPDCVSVHLFSTLLQEHKVHMYTCT